MKGKSTQSILTEVHDNLVETFETGEDSALVLVDQSKAFKIIDHEILKQKLKIIGFTNQALNIMTSYLADRRQYVQIQTAKSDCLVTGPQSGVQGSTLSGVLYLIYILDLPYITHETIHKPAEYRKCCQPNLKTFIDDCMAKVNKRTDSTLQMEVTKFMNTMEDYASANKLIVNPDKTKVIILSKNQAVKDNFLITLKGQEIKHSPEVTILRLKISDNLMWECHVQTNLLPQIKNRVRSFKIVSRYLGPKFRRVYANSIYRSKILNGIESWGGIQKTYLTKLQQQQDIMTKITLGRQGDRLSPRQRQCLLKWLPLKQEIEMAMARTTFNIILERKNPEEISSVMPQNLKGLRIKNQRKLDTKPAWLTKSKVARATFRAWAYKYNTHPAILTQETKYSKFKKDLKNHYLDKYYNEFTNE